MQSGSKHKDSCQKASNKSENFLMTDISVTLLYSLESTCMNVLAKSMGKKLVAIAKGYRMDK